MVNKSPKPVKLDHVANFRKSLGGWYPSFQLGVEKEQVHSKFDLEHRRVTRLRICKCKPFLVHCFSAVLPPWRVARNVQWMTSYVLTRGGLRLTVDKWKRERYCPTWDQFTVYSITDWTYWRRENTWSHCISFLQAFTQRKKEWTNDSQSRQWPSNVMKGINEKITRSLQQLW